jgi:hypothetical protein
MTCYVSLLFSTTTPAKMLEWMVSKGGEGTRVFVLPMFWEVNGLYRTTLNTPLEERMAFCKANLSRSK